MNLYLTIFLVIVGVAAAAALIASWILFVKCVGRVKTHVGFEKGLGSLGEYKEKIREGIRWFSEQPSEEVCIRSHDGLCLYASLLEAEQPRALVLLMHGYHGSGPRDFSCVLQYYHEQGFHILLPDQRAGGRSEGKYITFGIHERYDCRDWAAFAAQRYPGCPIILDGVSMGATTVLMASALDLPEQVCGVIADCGFTQPREIMEHVLKAWLKLPAFPLLNIAGVFARVFAHFGLREYSTIDAMKQNKLPIFFAHGGKDKFVPAWMSRKGYEACTARKELFVVPEAGHGGCFLMEREEYTRRLNAFFFDGFKPL